MRRFRNATVPGRIGNGGPVGGYIMDKLLRSRGLIATRFVSLGEGKWATDTTDRDTGEPRGRQWVSRTDGKYVVSKVPL